MAKKELTYERECGEEDILYTFVYDVEPYDPGKTSGPPENCYPPEGGFATVYEVRGPDGVEIKEALWESLGIDIKKIEELIYEDWADSQGDDDPPDPRDD